MQEFSQDMEFNLMMMNDIPQHLRDLNRVHVFTESTIEVKRRIKSFDEFAHKGTRGHAAIIAGSEGMMGAAILATSACMRSGTGKTTSFVPGSCFNLIHQSIPEALVKSSDSVPEAFQEFQSIAIGPGLGISQHSKTLLESALNSNKPLIIDADGINILSKNPALKNNLPKDVLLTPHHGEWERMFFACDNDTLKIKTSIEYCNNLNINMILKGHYSILITPNRFFINGTGNMGMAKAGSGDVLTGILVSLMAQGYSVEDAGIIGMYVHGLAGDFARVNLGHDYMTATDIIHYLSAAFRSIRN